MKPFFIISTLLFLITSLVFPGRLSAKSEDANATATEKQLNGNKKRKAYTFVDAGEEEIRMLRKLLELPPARLKILRKTIERMEKYSEEDRELMRRKLSRFKAGAPEERKKFIEQIRRRHELLQSYLSKFSPKQKIEEAKKFHALSLNEKRKFFEDLNRTSEKRKKF